MDQELRKLERQAASGDLSAKVAWITRKLRLGELTDLKVEMASWLGDSAAFSLHPVNLTEERLEEAFQIRRTMGFIDAAVYRIDNFDEDLSWKAQTRLETAFNRLVHSDVYYSTYLHISRPTEEDLKDIILTFSRASFQLIQELLAELPDSPALSRKQASEILNQILTLSAKKKKRLEAFLTNIIEQVQGYKTSVPGQYDFPLEDAYLNLLSLQINSQFFQERLKSKIGRRTLKDYLKDTKERLKGLALQLAHVFGNQEAPNQLSFKVAKIFLGWKLD